MFTAEKAVEEADMTSLKSTTIKAAEEAVIAIDAEKVKSGFASTLPVHLNHQIHHC